MKFRCYDWGRRSKGKRFRKNVDREITDDERERESTVWLYKRRGEKNPTPYWTLSDVSRTHKQHIAP